MRNLFYLFIINIIISCSVNNERTTIKIKDGESYLTINGINHWVKVKGAENKKTPIIIIHGGPGGNNFTFERTTGYLLEKFSTIIYYEQRGCGRSEAANDTNDYNIPILIDDLDKLIEMLGLNKVNLLGYSFGAELALRYTKQYPEKVGNLILESPAELSTTTKLIQIQGFYSIANNELKKKIEEIIEDKSTIDDKYFATWNIVSTSVVDSFLFMDQNVAKKNRQFWQESNLPAPGSRHFARIISKNSKGDLMVVVKGLKTRTLIICGIHDKNGGFHYGKDLNRVMPNSEFHLYKNSAHFPDMEEPEKFAADIKNFLFGK